MSGTQAFRDHRSGSIAERKFYPPPIKLLCTRLAAARKVCIDMNRPTAVNFSCGRFRFIKFRRGVEEVEEVCLGNSVLFWGQPAFNRFGSLALGRGRSAGPLGPGVLAQLAGLGLASCLLAFVLVAGPLYC